MCVMCLQRGWEITVEDKRRAGTMDHGEQRGDHRTESKCSRLPQRSTPCVHTDEFLRVSQRKNGYALLWREKRKQENELDKWIAFLHKHVPSCTTKQEGPDSVQIQHGFHRLSSRTLNEPYSDTQTNRVSCLLCWCAREIILFITFYFSSSFCFFLCFFLFLSDLSVVMH